MLFYSSIHKSQITASIQRIAVGICLGSILLSTSCTHTNPTNINNNTTPTIDALPTLHFLTKTEATTQIATHDEYTRRLSSFDIQAKTLKVITDASKIDADLYVQNAVQQVKDFTVDEKQQIENSVTQIAELLHGQGLVVPNYPTEIRFVRTTGKEEAGAAGYTRENAIYLTDAFFLDPEIRAHMLAHEMFHVWSRNNPETIRIPSHQALGFTHVDDFALLPDDETLRITNPDDPFLDESIQIVVDGQPHTTVLALIAEQPYAGGIFFAYLRVYLVDTTTKEKFDPEDREHVTQFFEKIGTTSDYIFSAEELAAEYFAIGVVEAKNAPEVVHDPAILSSILAVFSE